MSEFSACAVCVLLFFIFERELKLALFTAYTIVYIKKTQKVCVLLKHLILYEHFYVFRDYL
jgi:hypothetical protein